MFFRRILVMYDMPSLSPAYPHARYGHSTTLLTDNHLLLFGGCLRYESELLDVVPFERSSNLRFLLAVVTEKVVHALRKILGYYILIVDIGNVWENVQQPN